MIVQEIVRYTPTVHISNKPKVLPGSAMHRQAIYSGTITKIKSEPSKWDFGCEVRAKGKGKGTIINYAEYDFCEWEGMKVKPIEVWMHDKDDFIMFHPSDLTPV